MRLIFDKLREARRREEGFTLIELLIVILVLGILAGIAVFASTPFANRAADACAGANDKIGIVADAAVEAGVSGDLYADAPDCGSGFGGGGGGGTFTATQVQENSDDDNTVTLTGTAGNLLVAIAGHRTTPTGVSGCSTGSPCVAPSGSGSDPSAAGWTFQGQAFFQADGTNDRRGIAVFTKIADGSDSITVNWPGIGTGMNVVVREFARDSGTWANTASFARTNLGPTSSPYTLTGASGSSGASLQVVGVMARGSVPSPSLSTGNVVSETGSTRSVFTGFANVSGAGPHGATFSYGSWTGGDANEASAVVLVVR